MIVRVCKLSDLTTAPNWAALLAEYAAESADPAMPTMAPDFDEYERYETLGLMHCIGVFEGDELAGFLTVLAPRNPKYSAVLAVAESFYVAEAHRSSMAVFKLMVEAEALAKELGSFVLVISTTIKSRLSELLPRCGYRKASDMFIKRVTL